MAEQGRLAAMMAVDVAVYSRASQKDDLLGHSVNVAARLMALAAP
jgi:class 3 adenylate cyclase